MPARQKPKLFISYAHRDGAGLAQRLLDELKAAGHEVWLDTERLTGGSSWTNEIAEAIDACDVVVALLSHASYDSRICRAEQLRALRKKKRLIPCKVEDAADIPLHLETDNWISFDHDHDTAFQKLTDAIGGEQTAAIPKQYRQRRVTCPPLPQAYVPRGEELGKLRDLILEDLPVKQTVAITGVRGEGGIGKSVLAQALCADHAVQDAYPDGVIWVTIGQKGEQLVEKVRSVGRALGDEKGEYIDLVGATSQLRTILRDKAALLVLDDVWDAQHAQPFLAQDTPRCRYLFTTRRQQISIDLLAEEIPLNVLEPDEAKRLLAKHAGIQVAKLPAEAETIVEICGGLAIALSHVGDEARKRIVNRWPDPWGSVVADLRKADFEHYGIAATFDVSINSLEESYRQRYLDMAVFPDDTSIPMATLATFWQVDEPAAAYKTVDAWIDASLARKDQDGRVYLHDLQMDYVKARARERERDLHRNLLDAYQQPNGAWTSLADDGYILDRLARHLKQAGREPELRDLLLDPAWLRLRLRLSSVSALESDYNQLPDDQDLAAIPRAIRVCSHVLAAQPEQMSGQLCGRLVSLESPALHEFRNLTAETETKPWLRPLRASLKPEGGAELRVLTGHSVSVNAVALTSDGSRAVSASWDQTLRVWNLSSGDCLHTLEGHSSWVDAVALTSDGTRAVSASSDKTLRLWDLSSGDCLHTLEGHSDRVNAVALTPDGLSAVSASLDQTLRVWDLSSGECLQTLEGHSNWVNAVALTSDGTRAVSASDDQTLRVWDLSSGECLQTLVGHSYSVKAVALTSDGTRAVSASDDRTLRVWDLSSGDCLHTLAGHSYGVYTVALTPDGTRAVSASEDHTLRVWDLSSGACLQTLEGHSSSVDAVALTSDGTRAVSASLDQTLRVWDLSSGDCLRTLEGHSSFVNAVALTSDDSRAVSASLDHTLRVWDLSSGDCLHNLAGHSSNVHAVALTSDDSRAVSASRDRTLRVWDLSSGDCLHTLEGHSDSVRAVALTSDSSRAVSASNDHTLRVWDLSSGDCLHTLEGHSDCMQAVALTSDGTRVVSASSDHTLRVWDLSSGDCVHTLAGHSDSVQAVAFTPDDSRAVSASWDKTLRVWALSSGDCLHTLEGHSDRVDALAVTSDGSRAVSSSWDKTLRVWALSSGDCLHTLEGHSDLVRAVALTSDGSRVVSASGDHTLRVWALSSGDCLLTLAGHSGSVEAVALTPDGTRAVSASSDCSIRLWDLESGEPIACFTADWAARCCALSPDGKTIVVGDQGGQVHILEVIEPVGD